MRTNHLLHRLFLLGGLSSAALAAPLYTIQVINGMNTPTALNNLGHVAGSVPGGSVIWNGASLLPLDFAVSALNDAGQAAGTRFTLGVQEAVFWNGVTTIGLGTFGGQNSTGLGLNNAGVVVGGAQNTSGYYRPFVWNGAVKVDIGTLGGESGGAYAINSAGTIAGLSSAIIFGPARATIWNGGIPMSLGTLGGTQSLAVAINASGQAAGSAATTASPSVAFRWNGTTMENLGVLPGGDLVSYGRDINDAGHVVGASTGHAKITLADQGNRAFLYDGVTLHNLTNLLVNGTGWVLTDAFAINDAGQVAGSAFLNGNQVAYLATPVNTIPEPSTWALMLAGGALLALGGRRQR